ncbi:hypothetical protein HJP15_19080 [Pseudoalteromonas sp. NEC-BIFX-2020_002]|uniref:hypothetical protein n=1 Tax=Pseudoalteromonas sp. NEC-BIFX-2020_002 TaxID=2732353 RepID=UPI001476CFE1|nr:hypothetical protein [Pseudoalteromonas sp. NEC-BIFX-2020_002]NNG44996.1 hypothetical protein [Pseudoalteromonas sp. NEC-BIFX-2020_002]
MSSISELFNSTTDAVKSRISHPLLGSFVISWLIFNWKPIYYLLFADDKVVYKLKSINENFSSIETLLCYPLLATFFLAILIPASSLLHGIFLKFIEYLEVTIYYATQKKINDIHKSNKESYRSAIKTLKEQSENDKQKISKFERLTPLLAKAKIPESTLNDRLNSLELTKLKILEYIYENQTDTEGIKFAHLENLIDSPKLTSICADLEDDSLIETETGLSDFNPDTAITITSYGVYEIANIKANAFELALSS